MSCLSLLGSRLRGRLDLFNVQRDRLRDREVLVVQFHCRINRDGVLARCERERVYVDSGAGSQFAVEIGADGKELEHTRQREPDIAVLRLKLWEILEAEGKTLAALNASLFAADLSDQVGRRILAARRELGEMRELLAQEREGTVDFTREYLSRVDRRRPG